MEFEYNGKNVDDNINPLSKYINDTLFNAINEMVGKIIKDNNLEIPFIYNEDYEYFNEEIDDVSCTDIYFKDCYIGGFSYIIEGLNIKLRRHNQPLIDRNKKRN